MVLTIKKKFNYYKRFEADVWGIMKSTLNMNPFFFENKEMKNKRYSILVKKGFFSSKKIRFSISFPSKSVSKVCGWFWYLSQLRIQKIESNMGSYIYSLDELPKSKMKKRPTKHMIAMKLVSLFYLMYNARQFKRLSKKAFGKDGLFEKNYLCLLEGSLCMVVYSAGFFVNVFESLQFVKQGFVWVDGTYQSSMYFYMEPMCMMGFNPVMKGTMFWCLLRRLNSALILNMTPNYMYVSYTFLFFFWKSIPKGKEIVNPTTIDMLRLCNYEYFF